MHPSELRTEGAGVGLSAYRLARSFMVDLMHQPRGAYSGAPSFLFPKFTPFGHRSSTSSPFATRIGFGQDRAVNDLRKHSQAPVGRPVVAETDSG